MSIKYKKLLRKRLELLNTSLTISSPIVPLGSNESVTPVIIDTPLATVTSIAPPVVNVTPIAGDIPLTSVTPSMNLVNNPAIPFTFNKYPPLMVAINGLAFNMPLPSLMAPPVFNYDNLSTEQKQHQRKEEIFLVRNYKNYCMMFYASGLQNAEIPQRNIFNRKSRYIRI